MSSKLQKFASRLLKLPDHQAEHHTVWKLIFKDDEWLELVAGGTRFDGLPGNPVFIGPHLDRLAKCNQPCQETFSPPIYLWLLASEGLGYMESFFQCLRGPYQFDSEKCEIRFPIGIILNISELWQNADLDGVDYTHERLFPKNRLQTQYLYWRDEEFKIRKITKSDIYCVRPAKRLRHVSQTCAINLQYSGNRWPVLFSGQDCDESQKWKPKTKVHPISREAVENWKEKK